MSGNSPHIIVTEVPPGFLKRRNVRGHFSKFGNIVRLSIQSSFCVVTFEDHEQALNAVTYGAEWKDMPMKVDFTPNHDPFGSDDAIINEELNWFAEEPGVSEPSKKKAIKSRKEGKLADPPPQKIDFIENEEESFRSLEYNKHKSKHSNVLKTTKRSSERHSATKRFLKDINSRSKRSEEPRIPKSEEGNRSKHSDDNKGRSKLFLDNKMSFRDSKTSSRLSDDSSMMMQITNDEEVPFMTFSDDSRGRSKFSDDVKPIFIPSSDEKSYSKVFDEGKVSQMSESKRRERESSPMRVDHMKPEGKSILRLSEGRKRERDPSPVVSSQIKTEGKSGWRTMEDRKSEREPSPMVIDYLKPEEKIKKRESSPVVFAGYKGDAKSGLRIYDDKKRESESLPMVLDLIKTEETKIIPKSLDESSLFSKDLDDRPSKVLEENKISLRPNENPFYSKAVYTLKDKLDILEERDRQLRLKPEAVGMESVVQGTCPDMCPEKERILREVRNMVAPYEALSDGRMDHLKAVKEYTRSSADQGKPLPHELRPEPVLTMTMSYLINCIISRIDDAEEENLHNWYDFCWGRLRAIRKDIIQQDLCDENTVLILEQCARFHIACYDRLWGLSKSLFDDKLNTETLNNCLTSLTKFYKDLRQHGTVCPNEAEFNSYLILLNMNNGGFLVSEYQKFTPDLKKSLVIKEAVKIHLAYHNNMFSTYFKLIKNTSYLNACLAQRFFQHVRTEALNTIVKSHCTQNKLSNISVNFIINMLKLDSIDDCINFCESTGLSYSHEDKCFKVYRNDFYISEYIYTIETPSLLVVNKRIPIAEAVAGNHRTLPIYLKHTVHESFTADGVFNESAIDASDQEEKMLRDNVERKLLIVHLNNTLLRETSKEQSEEKISSAYKSETGALTNEEDPAEESFNENKNSTPYESLVDSGLQIDKSENVMASKDSSKADSNIATFLANSPPTSLNESNAFTSVVSSIVNPLQFTGKFQVDDSLTIIKNAPSVGLFHEEVLSHKKDQVDSSFESKDHELMCSNVFEKSQKSVSTLPISSSESNVCLPTPFRDTTKEFSPPVHLPFSINLPKLEIPRSEDSYLKTHSPKNKSSFSRASSKKQHSFKLTSSLSQEAASVLGKSISKKLEKSPKKSAQFDKLRKKLSENMKKVSARKYLRVWKEKAAKIRSSRVLEAMVQHNLSAKDYIKLWGKPSLNKSVKFSNRLANRKNSYLMVQIILHTDILGRVDKDLQKVGRLVVNALGETSVKKADMWGNIAQPNPVYWKLVFALPIPPEDGATFGMKLRSWCSAAFYPSEDGRLSGVEFQMSDCGVPVIYSVQVIEGLEELRTCANLSALVVVRVRDWETSDEIVNRIKKLTSMSNHPIPVEILCIERDLEAVHNVNPEHIASFNQHVWENSETVRNRLLNLAHNAHLFNIKVKPFCTVVEIYSEKLLDSLRLDSFLHDDLNRALLDPNSILTVYNQLIVQIDKEVCECQNRNYLGTAFEFKRALEKYRSFFAFPDNYYDKNFSESFSLRCKKCKLRPLKTQFENAKDLISFYKNYCEDAGCSRVLRTLLRYLSLPDEDSGVSISDHLRSIKWLPFVEILIKEILTSNFLTFKVAYRDDAIKCILDSRYWLAPGGIIDKKM